MFRSILSAAIVAGLGVSAAQGAVTWDWKYDANVTPNVSGSVTKDDGTPWSAFLPAYSGYTPAVSTASGGLYDASTLGTDNIGGWEYPVGPSNLAYFNSDTGYTVEWKIRINEIENDYATDSDNGGLGSIGMELEDGRSDVNQWFF